jgi:hypothetical protein
MSGSRAMRVAAIGLSLAVAACGGGSAESASDPPSSSTAAPLPALVVAEWEGMGVVSLCVEGVENYVDVDGITPVRDGIVTAFTRDDRMPVGIVSEGCDATIHVRVEGWAWSADYLNAGRLYTGAEVSGTLTLLTPGRPSLSARVAGDKPTAGGVPQGSEDEVRTPAGAPFWEAVNADVCGALIDWFGASDPLTLDLLARDAMLSSDGRGITGDCPGYEPGSAQN